MNEEWKLPPVVLEETPFFPQAGQVTDWGVRLLGIPSLWTRTKGEGITCAVLDTGLPDHPDLAGAVKEARDFTRSRSGPMDLQGHSTHCCGILGARDNDIGCVGVAPQVGILIGKVLGDNGSGSSAGIASAVTWAVEQGADVISMSLGSSSADDRMYEAIRYAVSRKVTVVVAAGNSGPRPNSVEYPGRWEEVICVGSYNQSGRVSYYSSRGPEVDIVAPGEKITSTYLNGTLGVLSGTSMATPFVAGVVSLYLASVKLAWPSGPAPTPEGVRKELAATALDIDAPGHDINAGWGLITPEKLLSREVLPAPAPSRKRTHLISVYSDGTVEVSP